MKKKLDSAQIISILIIIALYAAVFIAEQVMKPTSMLFTVLKKGATYALVAVSMNLLNGFTGIFSLGQAGFMLIGAYVFSIFTIPVDQRGIVYQYYDGGVIQFTLPVLIAMILAGLVAEGTTTIGNLHHIDRGYEDIVGKLKGLGADIQRISVKD